MAPTTRNLKAPRRWPLLIALGLLIAGIYVSNYQTKAKLCAKSHCEGFVNECKAGETCYLFGLICFNVDCDKVTQNKEYSEIDSVLGMDFTDRNPKIGDADDVELDNPFLGLGLPISLPAIPTYILFGYLLLLGFFGRSRPGAEDAPGRAHSALRFLVAIGILTLIYSAYLFYAAKVVIGALCTFCMVLYGVNFGVTGLAAYANGEGPRDLAKGLVGDLKALRRPMFSSAVVFVVASALTLAGYAQYKRHVQDGVVAHLKDSYENEEIDETKQATSCCSPKLAGGCGYLEKEDCEDGYYKGIYHANASCADNPCSGGGDSGSTQLASGSQDQNQRATASSNQGDRGSVRASSATPRPNQASNYTCTSSKRKERKMKKRRRPKWEKTESGRSFFEPPIENEDWVKGCSDALVTVVKFADFECSYCRYMDSSVRPLVKKYGDKVNWVMKHYPMNMDCNRWVGDRMHEFACSAAFGSHCAGKQGQFWEMHDALYDNQSKLSTEMVREEAGKLDIDMAQWDRCVASKETRDKIERDVNWAYKAEINGTPRAFVNGRLISGTGSTSIMDYAIQKAIEEMEGLIIEERVVDVAAGEKFVAFEEVAGSADAEEELVAPKPTEVKSMIEAKTASGAFWIDSFEASIAPNGAAVSLYNVAPTQASWFDAKAACEKAGKRLCTEEEWVSACTGSPAIDNNKNRFFADDDIEGNMYPYGVYYEKGHCRDSQDEHSGRAAKTGAQPDCVTPTGIFDLAGNAQEWVNLEQKDACLMGGDWRGKAGSACNRRTKTFGPGQRNNTIGFRCCADSFVKSKKVATTEIKQAQSAKVGLPLPSIELETTDGGKVNAKTFKGKVTYLTFFASWCGSCKRELPELNNWVKEYGSRGFQVIAVGVDRNSKQSQKFAEQFDPVYPIALDPDALTMGLFDINAMPTSFIVDRKGVIRHREVGFKKDEVAFMQRKLERFLNE